MISVVRGQETPQLPMLMWFPKSPELILLMTRLDFGVVVSRPADSDLRIGEEHRFEAGEWPLLLPYKGIVELSNY